MKGGNLKSANVAPIGAIALLDAGIFIALSTSGHMDWRSLASTAALRLAAGPVVVVVAIMISSLLPADLKAVLVFWRLKNTLPGHRAFSKFTGQDPRIDVESLKKNVGAFPTEPKEQNSKWYKLLKKVDTAPEARDAHGRFLLFRDLAGLSALLTVLAPVALLIDGAPRGVALAALGVYACQFLLVALAGRFSGERLVMNVLALHSVKKIK